MIISLIWVPLAHARNTLGAMRSSSGSMESSTESSSRPEALLISCRCSGVSSMRCSRAWSLCPPVCRGRRASLTIPKPAQSSQCSKFAEPCNKGCSPPRAWLVRFRAETQTRLQRQLQTGAWSRVRMGRGVEPLTSRVSGRPTGAGSPDSTTTYATAPSVSVHRRPHDSSLWLTLSPESEPAAATLSIRSTRASCAECTISNRLRDCRSPSYAWPMGLVPEWRVSPRARRSADPRAMAAAARPM